MQGSYSSGEYYVSINTDRRGLKRMQIILAGEVNCSAAHMCWVLWKQNYSEGRIRSQEWDNKTERHRISRPWHLIKGQGLEVSRLHLTTALRSFPGGPGVKNPPCSSGDTGSIPGLEDPAWHQATCSLVHLLELLKLMQLGTVPCNKTGPCKEKPAHRTREEPARSSEDPAQSKQLNKS